VPQLLDRLGWIDGLTMANVRYQVDTWEAFLAALDLANWTQVYSHDDYWLTLRAVLGDTKVRLDMRRDLIPAELAVWAPAPPPPPPPPRRNVPHLPDSILGRLA
jgi:hypothetical protein